MTNGVVAMGQAFWVYVGAGGGSLTIKENAKSSITGEFYRKSDVIPSRNLVMSINNGKFSDNVYIKNSINQSVKTNSQIDLPKLWNEEMNIYVIGDAEREMLTYSVKDVTNEIIIPIGLQVVEPGTYEISFRNIESFEKVLYLIDRYEGEVMQVSGDLRHSVMIKDSSRPLNDRFYLSSNPRLEWNPETSISVYPNPVNDRLSIQVLGAKENTTAILMDVNGKTLNSSDFTRNSTIDMQDYPAGLYILKVKTANGVVTKKIVKQE